MTTSHPEWTSPKGWSLVTVSDGMRSCAQQASRWAKTDSTVLLTGETGTGKSAIARAIHSMSGRSVEPFVPVNLAGLPAELADSVLFGHEKGAYTGAATSRAGAAREVGKGTLFLDEIGDLAPQLQGKLLQLLEERTFRPLGGKQDLSFEGRIIAATHRDLHQQQVSGGSLPFRRDLYYRVAVLPLDVPPLRERVDDIPDLVRKFGPDLQLLPEGLDALAERSWPGNVRELRHIVERIVAIHGPEATVRRREVTEAFGLLPSTPSPGGLQEDLDEETTFLLEMAVFQPDWFGLPPQQQSSVIGIAQFLPSNPTELDTHFRGVILKEDPARDILARAYTLALWRIHVENEGFEIGEVRRLLGERATRADNPSAFQGRIYHLFREMLAVATRAAINR